MPNLIAIFTASVVIIREGSTDARVQVFPTSDQAEEWRETTFHMFWDNVNQKFNTGIIRVTSAVQRLEFDQDQAVPFYNDYRVRVRRTLVEETWMDIHDAECEEYAEEKAEVMADDFDWDDCVAVDFVNATHEVVEIKEDK